MTTRVSMVSVLLMTFVVGACSDSLTAKNFNNPDVERVFAQPASIEQTLGTGYQQCRNRDKTADMHAQMATMSFESYSQLGNFNMGLRGALPRSPILNNKSAKQALDAWFATWSRSGRLQANALNKLDQLRKVSAPALPTNAGDLRARAMGFLNIGCNLGFLALSYDSAGIFDHKMASDSVPPLSGYPEVMAAAIANIDSAIAVANTAGSDGTGGFPTVAGWFSGTTLSKARFIELAYSWRARLQAGVARTPAERAAVNWASVAADAERGLKQTLEVSVGAATGWNNGVQTTTFYQDAGWSQITPMIYGFADVSGGYDTWLSTNILQRQKFLIVTPDLRFPQGTTRAAQQAASPEPATYSGFPYIKNRSGADSPGDAWGESFYEHHRFKYIRNNSNTGTYPEFLKEEVDLLAAEAYIRLGDAAKAAAKINLSRVRAGLPPLAGTSVTETVPGGASCVPRVPSAPTYTTTSCGSMLEAMKWEKRMELAYNYTGAWFLDSRGWGDLAKDTPLMYPVPVDELDARLKGYYNLGGGGIASAALGTYRF
ncbi:MAG TPA: RagB/SusD family nutrient uptake outer membrane protein [Gemmatimonadaceae bacterium]